MKIHLKASSMLIVTGAKPLMVERLACIHDIFKRGRTVDRKEFEATDPSIRCKKCQKIYEKQYGT